jgi:hypothetical protein
MILDEAVETKADQVGRNLLARHMRLEKHLLLSIPLLLLAGDLVPPFFIRAWRHRSMTSFRSPTSWNNTLRLRTGLIDQGLLALAFVNYASRGSFL